MRNINSVAAKSGMTLGLLPPLIVPMLQVVGPSFASIGQRAFLTSLMMSSSFSIADSPFSG
jgi:hypothetical protein